MPFPRNAEKYLCLHYVGSLGAELDLCSGEAGLETEWSIVGQGVPIIWWQVLIGLILLAIGVFLVSRTA